MFDIAAPPGEFLVGVPGETLQRLTSRQVDQFPWAAAGQVYLAVMPGTNPLAREIWSGGPGGCLRKFARGVVDSIDPKGKAAAVISGNKRSLVDTSGRELRQLPPAVYLWTNDGQLAEVEQSGQLTIYSSQGRVVRTLTVERGNPLGTLGPHSLIFSGTNLHAVDVTDGKITALSSTQAFLARGSPDGRFVAMVDGTGQTGLLSLSQGRLTPLHAPGPITGLLWSTDSTWLAISTRLGGQAYRAGDDHIVDLGAFNIVAWMQ